MFVKPLAELGQEDLALAGGKAANLGVLIKQGFPVPQGFCITTDSYLAFVEANRLQVRIDALLAAADCNDPGSLEQVSGQVRSLFTGNAVPEALSREIGKAYQAAGFTFCAVRSSATAEDLPGFSFAGQQDTYLNITGQTALLDAVRKCWGSLWTARAIAYRTRNLVPQAGIALAVVVQQMVASVASGVLFTANPLTGKRTETVIDATTGLGEALVSGLVEPDQYLVETASGQILKKTIGKKALSIRPLENGGTVTLQESANTLQALPDDQIRELTDTGRRAAAVFGSPQDVEWAWAGGKLFVVQSRPITSLYPLPANLRPGELLVLLSFGAVQGMLDPMTPLGMDMFRKMAVRIVSVFGVKADTENQHALIAAGGRLFLNITSLFRSKLGRQFLKFMAGFAEPGSESTITGLLDDPRLALKKGFMKIRTLRGFIRMFFLVFFNVIQNLLFPTRARLRLAQIVARYISRLTVQQAAAPGLAGTLRVTEKVLKMLPVFLFSKLIPAVACGQIPFQMLHRTFAGLPGGGQTVMELVRGLPHNVTTEMDMCLWHTACVIKADKAVYSHFRETGAAELACQYLEGTLPAAAQASLAGFLQQYGMRGLAEIDIGRRRWKENPEPLLQSIKSYLEIKDAGKSPAAVFAGSAAQAEAAGVRLIKMLEQSETGRRKTGIVRFFIKRTRQLAGLRETPKFTAIRIMTIQRDWLLAEGRRLGQAGVINQPDDLFYLYLDELKALARANDRDWKALIALRRAAYNQEKLRRKIPRILMTDGSAFYDGLSVVNKDNPHVITGSPVSAGVTEGIVHVILDPYKEQLAPGEILVCPGTDPSWTPLFLAAAGLIMEVGGMMTHGSVVAREYGIPAVVGVDQATTRLKSGQKIRIDGASGVIEIVSEE